MRKTIINGFRDFVDFNVIQYGHENCRPNYSIGNFVRSNHLIHYIHSGKGTYSAAGKVFSLGAGDAFLIYPDEITLYRADGEEPWEYSWVEFSGAGVKNFLSATDFSDKSPVARGVFKAEEAMNNLVNTATDNPYGLYGALLRVLGAFVTQNPAPVSKADEYVKYAVNYIHTVRYYGTLSVTDISDYVGINRSYLCRLFREKLGVSPKRYITEYRMKIAARLLENSNLTVGQVARNVGFEDPLYFSTVFKSFFGLSPVEYRKSKAQS